VTDKTSRNLGAPPPPDRDSPAIDGPLRILLVEDDEVDRRAVRRCLQQCGIPVSADDATSVEETLQRLASVRYDCILLDYYIPGVRGLALFEKIRGVAANMPVVIFTGRGDEDIAVQLMKAGAADYLPKASLTPERLASSLRHIIELSAVAEARRRAQEELRAEEARFRTLVNAIPQLAWMADRTGARYWFNDRWYDYTGTSFQEVQGWGWRKAHHPDHLQRVLESMKRSFEAGEAWEDTYPLRGKDGTYRWFLSRALPIRGEDGSIANWLGTSTDITEQKNAEAERERALAVEQQLRGQAEHATRARDEVMAIVVHDLRNPMNTILTSATIIGDSLEKGAKKGVDISNPPLSADLKTCVEAIQSSVKTMDRLICDLLDVSRMEAGSFSIQRSHIDIAALLEETLKVCESQARTKKITVTADIPTGLPPVHGDRDRLEQVLSNLFGNAFKFTPEGGRVMVRARKVDASVEITVEDSGPGIPAADLPRIFDRYWRGNRASRDGAGLGLAICKGIVDAHGGNIWVESTLGRGTTFRFTVPCAVD
jgi:PAS domain S-box-containing protein